MSMIIGLLAKKYITHRSMCQLQKLLEGNCAARLTLTRRVQPFVKLMHSIPSDLRSVSLTEIKRLLRAKQIGFEDGHTCLRLDCPLCRITRKQRKSCGKLYINKITGFFLCHSCQLWGPWDALESVLTTVKLGAPIPPSQLEAFRLQVERKPQVQKTINELLENSTPIELVPKAQVLEILARCQVKDFPRKNLQHYDLRVHSSGNKLVFPLYYPDGSKGGCKVLEFTSEPSDVPREVTYPGDSYLIAGWKNVIGKQEAVLVQSLLDALALSQHTNVPVLSLPAGIKHLPLESLPLLEHLDKLTLWLGNDLLSWSAARTFSHKLSERRCFFVRPSEDTPAPFLALQHGLKASKVLEGAQPMGHRAITTFSQLRDDVLHEFSQAEEVAGVKWKRFPSLNRILKGHRRGELTVFTGPTGSGKTTLMSDYSLDLCMQGVNTLWGSFELSTIRLAKVMLQQFAEKSLDKNLSEYDYWADKFEQLPMYFMTYHGQQHINAVIEAMSHATYVYDIAHVIVDNLQFMMGTPDSSRNIDRFWQQDIIVGKFRSFATTKNCHVTLVIHPRKERETEELMISSIFGSAKSTQEADNVLILQDRRQEMMRGRKYLQVTKNRYSGDLGHMLLDFNKESLSYASKKHLKGEKSKVGSQEKSEEHRKRVSKSESHNVIDG